MKNKQIALVIALLAFGLSFGLTISTPLASVGVADTTTYSGVICACKNSEACYEGLESANCNHNLITNAGKEAIEDYLSAGAGAAFDYLAVGNGTAPGAASTTLDEELTGGLARSQGVISDNGVGNWSLAYTYTADATFLSVNSTAIFNDTSAGTMLAGGTFDAVNLNSGDTLTVNYTLAITT